MKKTGKVLSLVLSLALVASSLVATTASAANVTSQGTGTVSASLTKDAYTLAYNAGNTTASTVAAPTVKDVVYTDASGYEYKNTAAVDLSASDWSISGTGAKLVNGYITATGEGTATFTATKSVSVTKTTDATVTATVPATFKFTVRTLDVSKKYLVVSTDDGKTFELPSSIEVNEALNAYVYTPTASSANSADLSSDMTSSNCVTTDYTFSVSNTKIRTISAAGVTAIPSSPVAGSFQITATPTVSGTAVKGAVTVNSVYKAAATTTIQAAFNSSAATVVDGNVTYNVTNYEITGTGAVNLKSGTVSKITTSGAVTIDGGSVSVIDKQASKVIVNDGVVGTIYSCNAGETITVNGGSVTTVKAVKAATSGTPAVQANPGQITVSKGTVKTIDSQGDVTVNGGTVSGIAGYDVVVYGSVADVPATVAGNITASDKATIGNATQSATTTVSGTVACNGTTLTIAENNSSSPAVETVVGNVVGAKANSLGAYSTALVFSGFNGSVPTAPQFLSIQSTSGSNAAIGGKITVDTVTVDTGSTLTVPDAYVGTLSGPGTFAVPAGKLVAAAISGSPALSLTTSAKVGDLAYKSAGSMESAFNAPGFTFEAKALGNNVYGYYVKTVSLVGLKMSASTMKVAKGYSAELSVATDPISATLPAGAMVKWEAPDGAYVSVVGNGMTATVKASDWSDINLGGVNDVTVTATIVDKDGNPLYAYNSASCVVTVIEKPEVVPASFKIDSVPKTMKIGQQYTVKITGTDATAPQVAFAGDFAIINSKTVSGYDTFVKFTAAKSGEHGMYVSGNKVAVIKVDTASICDTKTVTKKAGQSYTFKVTSSAVSFVPQFGVATVSGNIKPTKQVGKDFYYTVKATSAKGAHGVYINGVKVATYTFA